MRVELYMAMDDAEPALAFIYDDTVSSSHHAAAERLVHITSSSIHNLNPEDYKIRTEFINQCLGYCFSVGDHAFIGGVQYTLSPMGMQLQLTPRADSGG